ncbi:MAG: helix-turn-helix transcriptional regulator [Candidatus Dormibacteraeota bacterium]|nr:helix-turn-helix transcriptional regulator [Candidatus Dormibacteraeota bacterium]
MTRGGQTATPHDPILCASYQRGIELIGRRWTGAIISVLVTGPKRFSELAQGIPGVSERLLSERLRELEAEALVTRHVEAGPPLAVRYELTVGGQELEPALVAVAAWAERWMPEGTPEPRPEVAGGRAL